MSVVSDVSVNQQTNGHDQHQGLVKQFRLVPNGVFVPPSTILLNSRIHGLLLFRTIIHELIHYFNYRLPVKLRRELDFFLDNPSLRTEMIRRWLGRTLLPYSPNRTKKAGEKGQ